MDDFISDSAKATEKRLENQSNRNNAIAGQDAGTSYPIW
jgi:hypothetical protein